jgi:hypothetical protein
LGEEFIGRLFTTDMLPQLDVRRRIAGQHLQSPVNGAELVGQEINVALTPPSGQIDGNHRLSRRDQIDEDTAETLE